jgi:hypothetical protein
LNERNNKYLNIHKINNNIDYSYFNEWLSGFIEAGGYFSIRNISNNHSFYIGQQNDKYILDMIKYHFNINNDIKKKENKNGSIF